MNATDLISRRPVSVAVCLSLLVLASGAARADDEDTPLYLSVSHRITRDTNFSKDAQKQGETINDTSLKVGIDKAYGRQRYRGEAAVTHHDYAHYGDALNNNSKSVSGTVSSGIASNWLVTLDGSYDESLNAIQNNTSTNERVVRNIRKYSDANVTVQYGNGGRWAVVGSMDTNKLRYSQDAYRYQNADQNSGGLKLVYYSSDLLNFGLGARQASTTYPNYQNGNTEETVDTDSVDLSANWRVTGLSDFNGFYSRRKSSYDVNQHDARGWTAGVGWRYTPRGLLTYHAGYSRATGNDRYASAYQWLVLLNADVNYNTVTTTYNLGADYQLTGKVTLGLDYTQSHYATDNETIVVLSFLNNSTSNNSMYSNLAFNANYAYSRSVKLGCGINQYKQTRDATRISYDGRSANCFASLTID
jgi:hypothetical protein